MFNSKFFWILQSSLVLPQCSRNILIRQKNNIWKADESVSESRVIFRETQRIPKEKFCILEELEISIKTVRLVEALGESTGLQMSNLESD